MIPRLITALAAAMFAASAITGVAFAAEPIKVGASLPLTGGFSVTGDKHKVGYELCVGMINDNGGVLGRKLELIVSDNRSDTETAISQYERMINVDKVDVIFGTFSSKLTFPVSAITERYGMVNPIPSGGALRIYSIGHKNLFYFQQNAAEHIGESVERTLKDLVGSAKMPKTVAIVRADDFFANGIAAGLLGSEVKLPGSGKVVANLAPGNFADLGMKVVLNEKWPEEGFSDWVTLANSIKRSNAEFLVALTASAEEAVQLTRALQTLKYQPKAIFMSQGTQNEYLDSVGKAAEGIMIHSSWHPAANWQGLLSGKSFGNNDFIAAFKAKYGAEPDEDGAIPFALCQGMEQAIRGAGSTDNKKLADWLHARTAADPVKTILGSFHWDARGLPVDRPHLMTQWQGGKLRFIYPTDEFEGTSPIVYPKPQW
ncbi:MAG: amino acid ABC transporter substrate-binding protein [Alphaproteobacteria bacterium]|nr:amino acid ABC transporter substrate-binding protein [Alphaproteobacteria bacterium]